MKGCWLILLLAATASTGGFGPVQIHARLPDSQIEALWKVYAALDLGSSTTAAKSGRVGFTSGPSAWDNSTDACTWLCVQCNDNQTTVTKLTCNMLQQGDSIRAVRAPASLPEASAIAAFPDLEVLDFTASQLLGNLPSISAALASLKKLRYLMISGNRLEGSLPPEIGSMPRLSLIQLGFNLLTGSIPEEWGALRENLLWLSVRDCNLTGTLPAWFQEDIPKLYKLYLQNNKFEGSLNLAINRYSSTSKLEVTAENNYFNSTGTEWGQTEFWQTIDPASIAQNCLLGGSFQNQRSAAECSSFYAPPPPSQSAPPGSGGSGGGGSVGVVAGAAVGAAVLVVALAVMVCCFWRKRVLEAEDSAPWRDHLPPGSKTSAGASVFSFHDIEKMTGKFAYEVGRGGFGPVYYGLLRDGSPVAVKRREKTSSQGVAEFAVEVDVLSNLARHNHLVNLVGFCYEKGEQILVYEYMPNGTLSHQLRQRVAAASGPASAATSAANSSATSAASSAARPSSSSHVSAHELPPSHTASAITIPETVEAGEQKAISQEGQRGRWSFFRKREPSPATTRPRSLRDAPTAEAAPPPPAGSRHGASPRASEGEGRSVWGAKLPPPPPVSEVVLAWRLRVRIALGAARGVNYLHAEIPGNKVLIHRDLKPANILLDEHLQARVADFGLAKLGLKVHDSLGEARTAAFSTNIKGTPGFLDPEYFQFQQLTPKSDVYSFGVILLMLVTGRPLLDQAKLRAGADDFSLQEWALPLIRAQRSREILDPAVNAEEVAPESLQIMCELALVCLEPRGRQRPTMQEVVTRLQMAEATQKMLDREPHDTEDGSNEDFGGDPQHRRGVESIRLPSLQEYSKLSEWGVSQSTLKEEDA